VNQALLLLVLVLGFLLLGIIDPEGRDRIAARMRET